MGKLLIDMALVCVVALLRGVFIPKFAPRSIRAFDCAAARCTNRRKFTLRLIKQLARVGRVTVMCHCAEDQQQCHRHELRKLILSNRV